MGLPTYEPQQVPEGRYKFQVIEEPEKRKKTSPKTGTEFVTVLFSFKLTDEDGNVRYHKESLVPWSDSYRDLLLAFGAKPDKKGNVHLGDEVAIVGKEFEAEISHEPDRDDSTKTWSRIANIKVEGQQDVPPPPEEEPEEGEKIPF